MPTSQREMPTTSQQEKSRHKGVTRLLDHLPASGSGTGKTAAAPTKPKRARMNKNYKEDDISDQEDISSASDDSDEYLPTKEDSSSEEEVENDSESEENKAGKGKGKKDKDKKDMNRLGAAAPTDDESDDEEDDREGRRNVSYDLRAQVQDKLNQVPSVDTHPSLWVPDDQDKKLLRKWIVTPLLEQSSKWLKFKKKELPIIKDMVASGILPVGENKRLFGSFVQTPSLYIRGLETFLGLY